MAGGQHINTTEDRAVMHMALRCPSNKTMMVDGKDVVLEVHEVLQNIKKFATALRSGEKTGSTGKQLKNIISIGIGGSYLGPEFVYEALRFETNAKNASEGRQLRFLANVDPVDVARAVHGFNPEETLVIIVSKTFTTAETMLNARTLRKWLLDDLTTKGVSVEDAVAKHMIAVSAAVPLVEAFGIKKENIFGFWDWVGGRYSVTSSVGITPLAIHYGYEIAEKFLAGAHDMDKHLMEAPLRSNLPVIMGLLGVWNSSFLGHASRALLPYSQALVRFAAHIQQVDMESNGKRVTLEGVELPFQAGEVNFGEPGTNGQHSFYQLIHQGRVIPCDFIGFCESQFPVTVSSQEPVSNHDELMSNFFAQPDALARGKSIKDLEEEGVPAALRPHKMFPGNRPSISLLFPKLDAFTCGQLLALYEHRTAVQGAIWGVNSFDQWGVELGKVLAKQVRGQLEATRKNGAQVSGFNSSTSFMLKKYLAHK
jgi:glucose-6-phosphate isomerase